MFVELVEHIHLLDIDIDTRNLNLFFVLVLKGDELFVVLVQSLAFLKLLVLVEVVRLDLYWLIPRPIRDYDLSYHAYNVTTLYRVLHQQYL